MTTRLAEVVADHRDDVPPSLWSAPRRPFGLLVSAAVLFVLMLLSIAIGSKDIGFSVVVHALLDSSGVGDDYVIWDLRVPRTLTGVAVGVALGVAGALIQALTRNPLADPGILGVSSGSAFFVALAIGMFGVGSIQGYVWWAFLGALVVTAAVYAIGSAGRGPADPVRLTLAGVALGAVLSGAVTAMVLLDPGAFEQMRRWNAGSTSGRGMDVLGPVLPFLALGLMLAVWSARSLNALALGEDLASTLGARVGQVRVVVIVAVTLLVGGATAISGPIGFVGLMVPHIARWFVGPDQRWILAYTLLLAPSLLLGADVLGRVVLASGEIPVGIVMPCLGGPILILLVRRKRVSGL